MKKYRMIMTSLVFLLAPLTHAVDAHSPAHPAKQEKNFFIPNAKPTDWGKAEKLPLPTANEWKASLKPLDELTPLQSPMSSTKK